MYSSVFDICVAVVVVVVAFIYVLMLVSQRPCVYPHILYTHHCFMVRQYSKSYCVLFEVVFSVFCLL